jgi:peptide/nickel transport system ATP-binding protein
LFEGQNLLAMPPAKLREVRGRGIAMIFQNPLSSLHPLYRIGWQIVELIQAHEPVSARQARARAIELLGLVGIPRPDRRVDDYPHQFSGGMLQRSMIAMALALNPRLLIADEPTTALDVTVQAQILRLLRQVQREFGTAIIMITHDLGVVAEMSDHVVVMYAGRAMETAPRRALFQMPAHPYTRGLFGSLPRWDLQRSRLSPIPGQPPSLIGSAAGMSVSAAMYGGRRSVPHRDTAGVSGRGRRQPPVGVLARRTADVTPVTSAERRPDEPLLQIEHVVKNFPVKSGHVFARRHERVYAVSNVSLEVRRGETLALVGESGCGKSTLARCILRIHDVTAGRIVFDGQDITAASDAELRAVRKRMQMVFQDPYGSLNPQSAGRIDHWRPLRHSWSLAGRRAR